MTRNQLAYWDLQEKKRSNLANEKETNRSNVARETETTRHNTTTEIETNRHNLATEKETNRSNRAQEFQQRLNFSEQQRMNNLNYNLDVARLGETSRSNRAKESLTAQQNANTALQMLTNKYAQSEVARHNLATEKQNLLELGSRNAYNSVLADQSQQKIDETIRSNLENERIKQRENMLNYSLELNQGNARLRETERHNRAQELETTRHNKFQDYLGLVHESSSAIGQATRTAKDLMTIGGAQ